MVIFVANVPGGASVRGFDPRGWICRDLATFLSSEELGSETCRPPRHGERRARLLPCVVGLNWEHWFLAQAGCAWSQEGFMAACANTIFPLLGFLFALRTQVLRSSARGDTAVSFPDTVLQCFCS